MAWPGNTLMMYAVKVHIALFVFQQSGCRVYAASGKQKKGFELQFVISFEETYPNCSPKYLLKESLKNKNAG